jgi:hypothetical protein
LQWKPSKESIRIKRTRKIENAERFTFNRRKN